MSIASEISRISQNVADSLTEVAAKGVIVPSGSNSDDLPELIRSIPTGSGSAITVTDEEDEHGGIIRHINAVSLAGITVTAAHLETGYTAVNALGETITGVLDPGGGGGGTYQAKTNINPSTSSQTITPDNGYDALSSVQINAMPAMTLPTSATSSATTGFSSKATISRSTGDQYINIPTGYNAAGAYYKINGTPNMTLPTSTSASATSGYTSKLTVTRSTSDQYINIPTGYNTAGAYYKINAVQNGSVSSPTATKGTVSNHSVTVTPSVNYGEGYISGGTSTGTAVTVSASELVSGTKTITENGTGIDVTNYATVDVQVSGGGTQVISISDTTDANGGTIRTVTAVDISDTTATASDVASGKYFYTAAGVKTAGTGSGGGSGATQHVIHLEFADSTDTDIDVYYDDALIGTVITSYNPSGEWTYNNKIVVLAQLDNVTWYQYTPIPLNTQLVDYTSCVSGYCIDEDGSLHTQEWSWATDYTPILPNMTFSYRAYYWFYIGFYDESHTAISTLYVMNDATQDPNESNTGYGTLDNTKIPVNAKYTRLCGTGANSNYISLIRTA